MTDLLEMKVTSPTGHDTPIKRFKEFMMYGTAQFMQRAATEILISMDKNNAKAKKCTKYLAKIIDVGATGLGVAAGLGPMSKSVGSATGTISTELMNEIVKTKAHKKSKRVEKFLESFEPESELWIMFILECFAELFLRYVFYFSCSSSQFLLKGFQ